MRSELDVLLDKVEDPVLRADLRAQIERIQARRSFGLVFESHLPERVRLPEHAICRSVNVVLRDNKDSPTFEVLAVKDGKATMRMVRNPDGTSLSAAQAGEAAEETAEVESLVVIADFGEPIYPGLRHIGSVTRGGDKPAHVVIKGENHHALELLQFTHAGKVDCIYIDPPYNLGGDLTYDDKRVAKEDAFRHSKWLAFVQRRLHLAKELLAETGAIIVAVDDTEQAHLRMLMDQVFAEGNFIAQVVWQGGRKNDARFVSTGHDYMLIYARSQQAMTDAGIRWRERKAGIDTALAAAERIWANLAPDAESATVEWRRWLKAQKMAGVTSDAVNRYDMLEAGTGRPMNTYGNLTWPGGGGPRYEVLHPTTGKPVTIPNRGWLYSDEAKMQEMIAVGRVYFGPDEKTIPRGISYLDELSTQVAISVFEQDRKAVNAKLRDILGEDRFKFPKDTRVLARWIDLVTTSNPDAVILDFFVGSGATGHAVMELNAADGGQRQCILVTNNELEEKRAAKLARDGYRDGDAEWEKWGIFEFVTRPRIETVTTGVREDGSVYSEGFEENVEFFELTYLDVEDVELDQAFAGVAPLLWLRAGGQGTVIEERTDDAGEPTAFVWTARYGVLFDPDRWRGFVAQMPDTATTAFVVTDSQSTFTGVASELPPSLDVVRLYENYLTTFAVNRGR